MRKKGKEKKGNVMPITVCTECGQESKISVEDYPFRESGLSNVVLKGVEVARCGHCGNVDVTMPRLEELLTALAMAIVKQPYPLQGEQLRYLRKYLNMSQATFAEPLNVDKTSISKWENDEDKIGPQSDRLIRLVVLALGEGLMGNSRDVVNRFTKMGDRPVQSTFNLDSKDYHCEYV